MATVLDKTAATSADLGDALYVIKDASGTPSEGSLAVDILATGWFGVTDSWTYASASTINVPSGAAAIYQAGDKIRWKQGGGYKYGVMLSVADTLITIIVNTDHVVENSPITDIAISRVHKPLSWPLYFNFASVITPGAGSITSYTVNSAKWIASGSEIEYIFSVTITNNGTGSGYIRATVPAATPVYCNGNGREVANTGYQLSVTFASSMSYVDVHNSDSTYPATTNGVLLFRVKAPFA